MPDDDKTPSSSEMVSLFSKRKHSDGVEPGSGGVVDDTEAHQLQAQVLAPDFGSDLEANPPLKPKNPDVKGKYTGTEHVQEYDVFADTSEDGPNYRNVRAQNGMICLGQETKMISYHAGRMDCDDYSHVQDSSRYWCFVPPFSPSYARNCARNSYLDCRDMSVNL